MKRDFHSSAFDGRAISKFSAKNPPEQKRNDSAQTRNLENGWIGRMQRENWGQHIHTNTISQPTMHEFNIFICCTSTIYLQTKWSEIIHFAKRIILRRTAFSVHFSCAYIVLRLQSFFFHFHHVHLPMEKKRNEMERKRWKIKLLVFFLS